MPKLLLLFLCLFLYFFNSSAQKLPEQEEKALLENLSKSAKNTQTLKASFTQEKYLDILSDKIISEGKILLKAPSKLKWVYDSPFNYIIILTEKEILINDEGKKNEINIESSKIFKQVSDLIINSVKGDLINEEKFEASFFKEGNFRIELLPIDQNIKEYFSKITLFIDPDSFLVKKIKLEEASSDYTIINFENHQLNEDIPNHEFQL